MATPTNHLTSHCGERNSYRADKMIPKSVMTKRSIIRPSQTTEPLHMETWAPIWKRRRRAAGHYARAHNKRARRYALKQAHLEAEDCLRSAAESATVS